MKFENFVEKCSFLKINGSFFEVNGSFFEDKWQLNEDNKWQ